jgi:hypothetical protein
MKWDQMGPSPLKASGGSHTKSFKKAWLARYSDQDKDKPFVPPNDNSSPPPSLADSVKSENSMDSFPPASVGSTVKEEPAPSPTPPVSRVKELAIKEEVATSSASEAECPTPETGTKKRSKVGKKRQAGNADKKAKEDKEVVSTNSVTKKQKVAAPPDTTDTPPVASTPVSSGKKKKKGKTVKVIIAIIFVICRMGI